MLDNVKSKYIIEEIFEKIKNKRKLNIIKYNKRTLSRLNINIENFEIYEKLKEFYDKYGIYIEDIDIKDLNLNKKCIGNKGLKDLVEIIFKELKELKELNLSYNQITDIKDLEKANLEKLNKLNLSNNRIANINIRKSKF